MRFQDGFMKNRKAENQHSCLHLRFISDWTGGELTFPSRCCELSLLLLVKLWYHAQGIVGKSSVEASPGKRGKKRKMKNRLFSFRFRKLFSWRWSRVHRAASSRHFWHSSFDKHLKAVRWIDRSLFNFLCDLSAVSLHKLAATGISRPHMHSVAAQHTIKKRRGHSEEK